MWFYVTIVNEKKKKVKCLLSFFVKIIFFNILSVGVIGKNEKPF